MSSSRRSKSRRLKRIAANVFVAFLAVVTVLLLVGLFLPNHYRVERSLEMRAKPEAIYAQIAGLRNWPEWTVWNQEMDPAVRFDYDAQDTGMGAAYRWAGPKMGKGFLKITKAEPAKGVWYDLEFDDGAMKSSGSLTMEGSGETRRVVWVNEGDLGKNPVNRYVGLFMDRWVGADFERGLARLKARVEGASGETK